MRFRSMAGLGLSLLSTAALAQPPAARPMMMDSTMMATMDSVEARFDRAVAAMNRTKGQAQIAAVVEAINALQAHHKAMRGMMAHMQGTMPGAPDGQHQMHHPSAKPVRPDTGGAPRRPGPSGLHRLPSP